jgi:hypothetical protein
MSFLAHFLMVAQNTHLIQNPESHLIEFDQTFGTAGYEPAFWLCHWLYLMT